MHVVAIKLLQVLSNKLNSPAITQTAKCLMCHKKICISCSIFDMVPVFHLVTFLNVFVSRVLKYYQDICVSKNKKYVLIEIRYSSIIPCLCLDLNNKVYPVILFFTRGLWCSLQYPWLSNIDAYSNYNQ